MSRRKEIIAAVQSGEYAYGTRVRDILRSIKRMEADERNAATPTERRRAHRIATEGRKPRVVAFSRPRRGWRLR